MLKLLFPSTIEKTKKHLFLQQPGCSSKWCGSDSSARFKQNLKTQPESWEYRTKKVKYTLNSQGYRTQEFDKIDWQESVVILGCSHVFGVGVDDRDTISARLSDLIKLPVVNLGAGGTSMTYALHNSVILKQGYPAPKAVVHVWTDYNRCVEYKRTDIVNHGAWSMEKNNLMAVWNQEDDNARTHAWFISLLAKQLWKSNTQYYALSYHLDTAELLECDYAATVDQGRDLLHGGVQTSQQTAELIAKNLNV